MSTWAIVVAGGSGERFGERKQYLALGDARVLDWALRSAAAATPTASCSSCRPTWPTEPEPLATVVVAGGATRSASVRAGLAAVPDDADGDPRARRRPARARPRACGSGCSPPSTAGADAAVPAVPVTDTLRELGGGDRRPEPARRRADAAGASGPRPCGPPTPARRRAPTTRRWSRRQVAGWWSWTATPPTSRSPRPIDLAVAELLCR